MKRLKRFLIILIILSTGFIGAAVGVWIDMARFAHHSNPRSTRLVVVIAPHESFDRLAVRLKQKDIIASRWRFKLLARIRGDDKRLKAGEYELSGAMTPLQILDTLVEGKVLLHRLTVPEGYTIDQIAAEIGRTGLADAKDFRRLARDPAFVADLGLKSPSVEGYLFPDTYYFPRGVSAREIIETMVAHFKEQISEKWRARAKALGMTINQVVTLASMIEKETGDPIERPIISSVFHNRLKKKMRLESDPTVIYGIKNFDGNLTRRDLETPTPYNTYRIKGLPPGPIANPGKASIKAALYPAKTDYLYFVSKQDGTHHFSTNIEDHNRAVYRYQLHGKR